MVRPLPPALPAFLDVVVFGILPPSLKEKTSPYSAKAASNKVSDLAISGWRVPFPMVSPPFRLKLRAKVAPLLLYPGVLLGLLSHLCYMRTTFFPFR